MSLPQYESDLKLETDLCTKQKVKNSEYLNYLQFHQLSDWLDASFYFLYCLNVECPEVTAS